LWYNSVAKGLLHPTRIGKYNRRWIDAGNNSRSENREKAGEERTKIFEFELKNENFKMGDAGLGPAASCV
jgi:hypothetical protein